MANEDYESPPKSFHEPQGYLRNFMDGVQLS